MYSSEHIGVYVKGLIHEMIVSFEVPPRISAAVVADEDKMCLCIPPLVFNWEVIEFPILKSGNPQADYYKARGLAFIAVLHAPVLEDEQFWSLVTH